VYIAFCHKPCNPVVSIPALAQSAISRVPLESPTRPGPPPGIYASAYNVLASIMGQLVTARYALVLLAGALTSCSCSHVPASNTQ
jgi:hypothetical protein